MSLIINTAPSTGGGGGGTPGGNNTELQYNNSGSFGGVSGVTSDGSTLIFTTQLKAAAGTQPAPSIIFGADLATGFYASSANSIDVSVGGNRRFQFISSSLRGLAGSAAAPVYTFVGDPDTGPYNAGANQYGIATGGVERTLTSEYGFGISVAGTASIPSLMINSGNSGFYAQASNGIAASANGSQIWRLTSAGGMLMNNRFQLSRAGNTASATSISLGTGGNLFPITGSTTISRISSTNWTEGSEITLKLPSGITIEHLSASGSGAQINLAGAANLTTTAVTYIKLVYDDSEWRELFRRVMP